MGRWLEHTVTSEVQAPAAKVWEVWSDLEAMPRWMRWIESVKPLDDPDLTDWTLAAQGFRFSWKARITQRVEAQQLHWESVGGLPTKGAVRFYPEADDRTVGVRYFQISRRRLFRRRLEICLVGNLEIWTSEIHKVQKVQITRMLAGS